MNWVGILMRLVRFTANWFMILTASVWLPVGFFILTFTDRNARYVTGGKKWLFD